jgi:hypothetical protein
MIAPCGQWYSIAYKNVCFRCEKSGQVTTRKNHRSDRDLCPCCHGSGIHSTSKPTGSRPFPAIWQR